MKNFDVGIIGAGIAGVFCALKIAKEHKGIKTILFDLGRPSGKRRKQMDGFLGLLPSGDGKLYLTDTQKVSNIVSARRTNSAEKWFNNYVSDIFDLSIVKDPGPRVGAEKKIKKSGFNITKNDYIQVYPKEIHALSKKIVSNFEKIITPSFDNEIHRIVKNKNYFTVTSQNGEYNCKRIIVCVGRTGWRWAKNLYESLGMIENNDVAKFGVRVEATSATLKDFNKSSCSIFNDEIEIGPMCWHGTVIPEDHFDMAISAFRSNEARWKSDRVSFNMIGKRFFENSGFEQTNRIGQLTFILSNDRIIKEKISTLLSRKSKISIMPEYNWLPEAMLKVGEFMPDILSKAYFHIPTIIPMAPEINIGNNLSTDVDGMFVAGESAGVQGILAAAIMGLVAADSVCK